MARHIKELPLGAVVRLGVFDGIPIDWYVLDHNHYGYTENTTVLFSVYGLKQAAQTGMNYNGGYYVLDPRPSIMPIRTWLNSDKGGGGWYTGNANYAPATTQYVPAAAAYVGAAAFLHEWSEKEKNILISNTIKASYTYNDSNSPYYKPYSESLVDKVFHLGIAEVGFSPTYSNNDGGVFNAFRDTSILKATTRAGVACAYWLRSNDGRYATSTSSAASSIGAAVNAAGEYAKNAYLAGAGYYTRPACTISMDTFVTDEPDADGIYHIVVNDPPIISGIDSDLGKVQAFFIAQPYIVNCATGFSVTEKIKSLSDDKETVIRAYEGVSGVEQQLSLETKQWQQVQNGTYEAIVVAHNIEYTNERKYRFYKDEDVIEFKLPEPLPADDRPEVGLVSITPTPSNDQILAVHACNNGFDENPTLENVTAAVKGGGYFTFNNETKTADKWGVNIYVTLRRGTSKTCRIEYVKIEYGADTDLYGQLLGGE